MIDIGSARLGIRVARRVAQEHEDDANDQRQREQERDLHVVDRLADRQRPVVEDVSLTEAEAAPEGGQDLLDCVDDLDRVRAGLPLDAEDDAARPLYQAAILSFCTLSTTWPSSSSRTGAPLR